MYIERNGKQIFITRLCGAISWPADKPGCACIVGEDSEYDYDLDAYPIYLIDEIHSKNNEDLIVWAAERRTEHEIDAFVGQRSKANIKLLSLWNREASSRRIPIRNEDGTDSLISKPAPRFHVNQAPFSQDNSLEYHLKVVMGKVKKDRKTLFLKPKGGIKMQLLDIQKEISEATPQKYPAVAAFAYAVATLNLYQRDAQQEVSNRRSHSANKSRNKTTGY